MDTELSHLLKHGFVGQRMIVIPKKIIAGVKQNPLINTLYFTDIGFFPNAANHSVERKKGSKQYILVYCYKGQGTIETDTGAIHLKPNTFYIIPPGVAHHYHAHPRHPWSIYWLHFTGVQATYLYEKFTVLSAGAIPALRLDERRVSLFDSLIDIMEAGYSLPNLEYVNIALWQLISTFLYENYFLEGGRKDIERNPVEDAIDYMKTHLEGAIKINDVAAHFNYSASHFFSIFKSHTGYSPINYFNHLKIQKACQYLSFTTMSIKEISFAVGFNDPLYFSRIFSKLMSTSPMQYRKEYS